MLVRPLSALFSALTLLSLLLASPSTPAAAENPSDVEAPKVLKSTITPATVDTANAAQPVSVTVRLSDNQSGVVAPDVYLRSPETGQYSNFVRLERINGDELYGNYRATLVIPQGAAPGNWILRATSLTDRQGNRAPYDAAPPKGWPSLTVIGSNPQP